MTQAEEALAEHNAQRAISTAQAASEAATQLVTTLEMYRELRAAIVQGRNAAEAVAAQGYRVDASHAALDRARAALSTAAAALSRGEDVTASLDEARNALTEAAASGPELVQLRAQNDQRLAALETRGQQVAQQIEAGRKTFDLVDEFAESTWNDIRGNGTEAQKAADQAHALWQQAAQSNTMETQEFTAARDDLDAADGLLNRASELIEAITKRLTDLQAARGAARDELAAATADIARGWEFVRANDPDVGQNPEQRLRKAEGLLQTAQKEAAKEQPDWLALVRQAQAANAEADAALADARSEFEAMEKLRASVERAQQVASGEVQKTVQFFSTHAGDMRPESQKTLDALQANVQTAYQTLQRASTVQEDARRSTLEDALRRYTTLGEQADKIYATLYADFGRLDKLRVQVAQERSRAENTVNDAMRTVSMYSAVLPSYAPPLRTIQEAYTTLRRIPERVEGEANLNATLETLRTIRNDARNAQQLIQRNYMLPQQSSGSDFGAGVLVGSLLEGALDNRPSHHHGGHHGGGGGGGGGGWGSGGGGGGSWGGGGGGGGSWGGGGGGGGSWGGGGGGGGGW